MKVQRLALYFFTLIKNKNDNVGTYCDALQSSDNIYIWCQMGASLQELSFFNKYTYRY